MPSRAKRARRSGSDDSKRALGKRLPNLVVVVDSETGAEFRVQCEVVIENVKDAALLSKQLRSKSKKQIREAKNKLETILGGFDTPPPLNSKKPTMNFKRIVKDSFDEVIDDAPNP
jgi:hypothetical protein